MNLEEIKNYKAQPGYDNITPSFQTLIGLLIELSSLTDTELEFPPLGAQYWFSPIHVLLTKTSPPHFPLPNMGEEFPSALRKIINIRDWHLDQHVGPDPSLPGTISDLPNSE